MAGGYVGWGEVVNQAPTSTGGASRVVANVVSALADGLGVGGLEVVNTFSNAPSDIPINALRTRANDPLYTRDDSILLARG